MQRLAERFSDALNGQLAVPRLAALVLGDRSQHRSRLAHDALLLPIGERG